MEGVIVYQRPQGSTGGKCCCCDGGHVSSRYIEIPGTAPHWKRQGAKHSAEDFIVEWLDGHRGNEFEGRRVRVSIELVEDEGLS